MLYPEIRFRSKWIEINSAGLPALRNMLTGAFDMAGELEISGQSHPVIFNLLFTQYKTNWIVEGKLQTTFSAFNIVVPTVGPGGMIADMYDQLDILIHLNSDKLPTMGSLLSAKMNSSQRES